MTVTVNHAKTNAISDWTQAQLDEQIALGNFSPGTLLADIVLPSDWNNDHTLTGLGTMAEQDATAVAITGGTINNTTIGATTATTGKFTSVTTPSVTATTNDLTLSSISTGAVKLNTAGGTQFQVNNTASATAWGQITGSTVSSFAGAIEFSSASTVSGSDAISINYATQQIGNHAFKTGVSKLTQLNITGVASVVNYHNFVGSATTKAPIYSVAGSDTNISMAFQPKGTGAIDLAAGSSGVNISNGGTVTAITRTATGSGYTSIPTIAVSAPTTAGGVQAVVTQASMAVGAVAINNGGTGYTVGNTLTVTGGTGGNCTITVSTVSSGVITGITFATTAPYTVLPTNPVSVTGGSGSSATFNLTYGISGTFTISNAGSGYIEQPTITFSGGGGSGAAAYATVGGNPTIRSLGTTLNFTTPTGGVAFAIVDTQSTGAAYWTAIPGTGTAILRAVGSSSGQIGTSSGVPIQFTTSGAEQVRFSHTASAVNYVQVTGAATTGTPIVQAQGSDTNVSLAIRAKGGGNLFFQPNNLNQFAVTQTASAVNYLQATGSAAGSAPAFSVAGTDTNIDLTLTPKGTGLVRFGTYVAGALLATGYINIKAADGTTYKVLVST
jgi:hypothetical protein